MPHLCMKFHSKTFQKNDNFRFTAHVNKSYDNYATHFFLLNILRDPVIKLLLSNNILFLGEPTSIIPINNTIIFAIDISGYMYEFSITLAACLFTNIDIYQWIPFLFDEPLKL